MSRSLVLSDAAIRTLFPATIVTPDDALLQPFPSLVQWPTHANVCVLSTVTPIPTPTPTVPATAIVAAIESSWYWLPAATRTDCSGSAPATFVAHVVPQ